MSIIEAAPQLLHEFFVRAARRWPDRTAVDVPPGPWRPTRRRTTYAELDRQSDALAALLRPSALGECVIAILLPRTSAHLYAAQIAVLKAGAAYACIEPTFPDAIISPPLFGEDNLPDPWSNPIIVRIQRAMNPTAVADVAYWNANRMSNSTGAWPAAVETVSRGALLSRQLAVFNDTFAGTAVDISWEMHQGTAAGPIADQGSMHLDIPLGQRAMVTIAVTAPAAGTSAVLVLQSSKDGRTLFRDDAQQFGLQ